MKGVIILPTANEIVKIGTVINKIKKVDRRYELSKTKSESLLNDLEKTTTSIESTSTNFWGNYRKEDLFYLIQESHNSTLKTTKITNELIQNSNENTKALSEMIGILAIFSGLSFQKISETSSELEAITEELEKGVDKIDGNSTNINRAVISQIKKIKEEKQKQEDVDYKFHVLEDELTELQTKFTNFNDYNFGVLNEKLKDVQIKFNDFKINAKKRIESNDCNFSVINEKLTEAEVKFNDYKRHVKIETEEVKRVNYIMSGALKKQKIMIYILFFLVLVTLISQLIPFI